jgi:hypothetical protein
MISSADIANSAFAFSLAMALSSETLARILAFDCSFDERTALHPSNLGLWCTSGPWATNSGSSRRRAIADRKAVHATRLGDKLGKKGKARITLVERSPTHIWKPLLYEIAAGSMDVDHHELDYLAQGHRHGFQFRYGEMTGIDRAERQIHLSATFDDEGRQLTPKRSFTYDTLVVAIGSVGNDFGTPGVIEHAIMLDTPEQAQHFNRRRCFCRSGRVSSAVEPHFLPEHPVPLTEQLEGRDAVGELDLRALAPAPAGLDVLDADLPQRVELAVVGVLEDAASPFPSCS